MTSTRFTDEEITYFDNQAAQWVDEDSTWRDWFPAKTIPMKRWTEWKILEEINDAAATMDGSRTALAASSYQVGEAQLMWLAHHFIWSELEVETARNTGNQISTEEIRLAYQRMNKQIARLIIQGNQTWEAPTIAGIEATAADSGATALDWEDAGGPYAHMVFGYSALTAAGYSPPFKLVCSTNLRAGLAAEHAAGYPTSSRTAITEAFELEGIYFEGIAAAAATDHDIACYPFEVSGDGATGGRWMLLDSDPNNFSILETGPPKLTIVPEMDIKNRSYYGRLDWFGTVKIVHATAVADEDAVDLQT